MQRKPSILLLVSLCAVCAAAQSNLAVLGGSVTDPQSHAVAGAQVVLMSKSTGAVRKLQTNDQGIYEVPGLQPGDYELTISASGFASQRKDLRLEVAQRLAIDLQLGVEEHKETVEIRDVPRFSTPTKPLSEKLSSPHRSRIFLSTGACWSILCSRCRARTWATVPKPAA